MYQPLIVAIWASDRGAKDEPLISRTATVTARARSPGRRSPKGGYACSASNDNLPSLVLGQSADGHGQPAHAH
jgi:hypothetical protein